MEKSFTFTKPDAVEIAYIIQRNQDNTAFLHKLLVRAINVEDICITHPRGQLRAGTCAGRNGKGGPQA